MSHSEQKIRILNFSTSESEIKDIMKAWLAISIAFGIMLSGSILTYDFYSKFILAFLTVGTGFLLHELGHKITAQRYGCFAEFRSFDSMLLLAIAMSFFGFVFAAPGAVMISGRIDKRKNGIISAAGPVINIALALLFLALFFMQLPDLFKQVAYYGFLINAWLALFNMLPFGFFDGYKVLRWSNTAYFVIIFLSGSLMLAQHFVSLPK